QPEARSKAATASANAPAGVSKLTTVRLCCDGADLAEPDGVCACSDKAAPDAEYAASAPMATQLRCFATAIRYCDFLVLLLIRTKTLHEGWIIDSRDPGGDPGPIESQINLSATQCQVQSCNSLSNWWAGRRNGGGRLLQRHR